MEPKNLAKCVAAASISLLAVGYVSTCTSEKSEPAAAQQSTIIEESFATEEVPVAEEEVAVPTPVALVELPKAEPAVVIPEAEPVITREEPEPVAIIVEPEPVEPQPQPVIAHPVVFKDPEPQQPVAPIKTDPEPKPEPVLVEKTEAELEYERSVKQLEGITVTQEEFNEDKAAVLALIDELDTVMKNENYSAWLKYLDEESIRYWSQRSNLQTAQKRLPVKGLKLNGLQDYFKYIFIPSRVGRKVDEIRYETDKLVKVVQVSKDENGQYTGDTVYYNLRKINGIWKVHLPEIS